MKNPKKNQGSNCGDGMNHVGGNEREGDYVMVVREILRGLSDQRIVRLSSDEKSLAFIVLERTIGFHCELREISLSEFIESTGISKRHVIRSLKSLQQKQVLKREKKEKTRSYIYGLNKEFFQRIYPYNIKNVYYMPNTKVTEQSLPKCQDGHLKGAQMVTLNPRVSATSANSAESKYTSNIVLKISLKEMRDFLNSRSHNSKKRWSVVIGNVLRKYPDDEKHLWGAIELIYKTQKDLLDSPIRSSVISLFENTEWETMKAVYMAKLTAENQAKEKAERLKKDWELIEAKRAALEVEQRSNPEYAKSEIAKIMELIKKPS